MRNQYGENREQSRFVHNKKNLSVFQEDGFIGEDHEDPDVILSFISSLHLILPRDELVSPDSGFNFQQCYQGGG
jgi:hypothetical protein